MDSITLTTTMEALTELLADEADAVSVPQLRDDARATRAWDCTGADLVIGADVAADALADALATFLMR